MDLIVHGHPRYYSLSVWEGSNEGWVSETAAVAALGELPLESVHHLQVGIKANGIVAILTPNYYDLLTGQ